MVNKRKFLTWLLAATLAGSASAAPPAKRSQARPAAKNPTIVRQILSLDGPITMFHPLGDRAVAGFWTPRGFVIVILPVDTVYEVYGIQEGDDGVDPLGQKEHGILPPGPTTANSTPPVR